MIKFDIVIIGGGIVGCAIARKLCSYQLKVCLVEKEIDVCFETSKSNSGIIHAGIHSSKDTLKGRLCLQANTMWDHLSKELNFSFKRIGAFVLAFNENEIVILKRLLKRGRNNSISDLEIIRKEEIKEREPNINDDVIGALYAPSAGIVGPYEVCFALIENAIHNGLKLFFENNVTAIEVYDKYKIVRTDKNEIACRCIINAAGLYADEIARMVNQDYFKIIPRKGEEYLLDKEAGSLANHILFPIPTEKSKGVLVIPTVDGTVMLGPTAEEIEDKKNISTTREGLEKVFRNAQRIIAKFSKKAVITSFAGLRPVAIGEDFIIEATDVKGFINVAGIQSPGLTCAPAIAEMVCEILVKEGLELKKNNSFDPYRKKPIRIRELDLGSLDRVIKNNPSYGNIVCRCEMVSEGEIIDAIKRGRTTLDSIKFMTRAGMGRCQGGFCSLRVIKILSRELGVSILEITKRGKGTNPLLYSLHRDA